MDRKTAVFISMGFEIIGIVIVAIYVGGWLDKTYELGGLGTAGAIMIGFIGWLCHLYVAARAVDKEENSGDTKPR